MAALFMAKTAKAPVIKILFEALKDMQNDCDLYCTPTDGIRMTCLDHCQTAYVSAHVKTEAFELYSCSAPLILSVDTGSLFTLIRSANSDCTMTFSVMQDRPNVLNIVIESKDVTVENTLTLQESATEPLNSLPSEAASRVYSISSQEFKSMCKNKTRLLSGSDGCMRITMSETDIAFYVANVSCSTMTRFETSSVSADDCADTRGGWYRTKTHRYMLRYLNMFNRAFVLNDTVKLWMDRSDSLYMEFATGEVNMTCVVAAVVEDDDSPTLPNAATDAANAAGAGEDDMGDDFGGEEQEEQEEEQDFIDEDDDMAY